jgi:hypothetical protein
MEKDDRSKAQEDWQAARFHVICATIAYVLKASSFRFVYMDTEKAIVLCDSQVLEWESIRQMSVLLYIIRCLRVSKAITRLVVSPLSFLFLAIVANTFFVLLSGNWTRRKRWESVHLRALFCLRRHSFHPATNRPRRRPTRSEEPTAQQPPPSYPVLSQQDGLPTLPSAPLFQRDVHKGAVRSDVR